MTELTKNKKISEEFSEIFSFFEELPEDKKNVVTPLIQNAAFMKVTLEDLQDLISQTGVIEEYRNGMNQSGMKQSAALQSYNALVKNYAAVIKTLYGLLPGKPISIPIPVAKKKIEVIDEEEQEREREEEFQLAVEYQRRQREENLKESFSVWKARIKAEQGGER